MLHLICVQSVITSEQTNCWSPKHVTVSRIRIPTRDTWPRSSSLWAKMLQRSFLFSSLLKLKEPRWSFRSVSLTMETFQSAHDHSSTLCNTTMSVWAQSGEGFCIIYGHLLFYVLFIVTRGFSFCVSYLTKTLTQTQRDVVCCHLLTGRKSSWATKVWDTPVGTMAHFTFWDHVYSVCKQYFMLVEWVSSWSTPLMRCTWETRLDLMRSRAREAGGAQVH